MQLTRPKVIVVTLLAVLVALGSASAVVFAPNGDTGLTLKLTPNSGCPRQQIDVVITMDVASAGAPSKEIGKLTSYPDGLITRYDGSSFNVGDYVCAGDYVVTAEIRAVAGGVGIPQTESVSTHFTVGGQGCPGLAPCRPVGGVVMPTNTLAITAPFLAIAGLVVAVSAVAVVKKRRD